MSPEQMLDALDCGSPEEVWKVAVAAINHRAIVEREAALNLKDTAKDAIKSASDHLRRAEEFEALAHALEKCPVTFASRPGPPTPSKPHGHTVIA